MSVKRIKVDSAKIPGFVDYTVELIREKKGHHIMIISLDKLTTFTDFLIICTVNSSKQGQAISDHILGSLKDQRLKPLNIEGYNQAQWILMDYIDFIVNIFDRETRDFYQLERIWRDAPAKVIKDEENR